MQEEQEAIVLKVKELSKVLRDNIIIITVLLLLYYY